MSIAKDRVPVLLLSLWVCVPEWLLRKWWVEDAGIAYSYARNLAAGDGLVAFPGGERVEGYSDPLWIALLALGRLLLLDPFVLAKVLGGLFAAACVPVAYSIVQRIHWPAELQRAVPLLASCLVATNAQHGIWASAGLENSLFSLLLGLGFLRLVDEVEAGLRPLSALFFFGLATTRPEGAIYAAVAIGAAVWSGASFRFAALWALVFAVPFLTCEATRYAYFALPFPMPFYAKVVDESFRTYAWTTRAWSYLVGWSTELGWVFLLPVFWAAVAGAGWRPARWPALWGLAFMATGLIAGVRLQGDVRAALVLTLALTFVGVALGRFRRSSAPGALPRSERMVRLLGTAFVLTSMAFAVVSRGDWMAGFRWFSLLVVPLSVVYAAGVADIVSRLIGGTLFGRRPAVAAFALLAIAPVTANVVYLVRYAQKPEPMTPEGTHGRMRNLKQLAATLHLVRPWVTLDHAMGGAMWWAPPQGRAVDVFGLTDVTFALQRPVKGFKSSWVLHTDGAVTNDGSEFDFAHVKDELTTNPLFLERFVALKTQKGKSWNDWVNRSLIMTDGETASGLKGEAPRSAVYSNGVVLEYLLVRAPEVSAGGGLYVELGLRKPVGSAADLALKIRLSGPGEARFDVVPGYGILPSAEWREGEVFMGRYSFSVPPELPEGTYALGIELVDAAGSAIATVVSVRDGSGDDRWQGGASAMFPGAVQIIPTADVLAMSEADWTQSEAAAGAGACADAEEGWEDALARMPRNREWEEKLRSRAKGRLDLCWAGLAEDAAGMAGSRGLAEAVGFLRRARSWDVRSPHAQRVGAQIARDAWPLAMAARASGDSAGALKLFTAIVAADPTRSWARRYAEEARSSLLAEARLRPYPEAGFGRRKAPPPEQLDLEAGSPADPE